MTTLVMAAGGPGDHPVTDILLYGSSISDRVDALVRELDETNRDELHGLPQWWSGVAESDLYQQLVQLKLRPARPKVSIEWVQDSWKQSLVPPGGWTFRCALEIDGVDDRWTADLSMYPFYPRDGSRMRYAYASFVAADAPWDALRPGVRFNVIFVVSVMGSGTVLDDWPWA